MSDRFKFRAWKKTDKEMYYNVEMTYDYPFEPRGADKNSFGAVLKDDDYIVEQCTGLKDKNGKLIYEGDIVKACLVEGYVNYIVKWGDCNWGLFFGNGQYDICLCERASKEIEIIGNIHTNADLLGV